MRIGWVALVYERIHVRMSEAMRDWNHSFRVIITLRKTKNYHRFESGINNSFNKVRTTYAERCCTEAKHGLNNERFIQSTSLRLQVYMQDTKNSHHHHRTFEQSARNLS